MYAIRSYYVFPFLSILACVIGTLILLIASLAITQMQSDPEEELVERVDEYKELEASNQELDKTIQDLFVITSYSIHYTKLYEVEVCYPC